MSIGFCSSHKDAHGWLAEVGWLAQWAAAGPTSRAFLRLVAVTLRATGASSSQAPVGNAGKGGMRQQKVEGEQNKLLIPVPVTSLDLSLSRTSGHGNQWVQLKVGDVYFWFSSAQSTSLWLRGVSACSSHMEQRTGQWLPKLRAPLLLPNKYF